MKREEVLKKNLKKCSIKLSNANTMILNQVGQQAKIFRIKTKFCKHQNNKSKLINNKKLKYNN